MRPDPAEISSRIPVALRDYAAMRLGQEAAEQTYRRAVEEAGGDNDDAANARSFVSVRVLQAIADAFEERLGPSFVVDAVTWAVPVRRDLSAMSLSALMTPAMYYENLDRARSYFVRHVSFHPVPGGRGRLSMELRYRDDLERHRASCRIARGVLMAVPLLCDLPPAEVTEVECWADGAAACKYEVRYPSERPIVAIGTTLGLAVAAVGAYLVPSWLWVLAPLVALLLARGHRHVRIERQMTRISEEHRRLLGENELDFQLRYDEIRDLNETLEGRVEARTRELEQAMTELRSRNAELRAMLEDMQSLHEEVLDAATETMLDRALREFEHEINNPMASVLANLEFLRIEHPTETDLDELDSVVKDIQTGMDRIRSTVAWFVRLHRSSATPLRCDVRTELTEAVRHLSRRWSGRVKIHLNVEDVAVPSYGRQLTQVMVNVIKNSADLSGVANVWITARREGDRARIRFEDDGPGIPPGVLPRVFERGFTTKTERGAQGLGLYISKTIVERHGGTISATSVPGGGAAFEILLPLWSGEQKPESKTSGVQPIGTATPKKAAED